jgi:hypothetical protein
MTIKDNFIQVRPTLILDFKKSKKFDPRITYSAGGTSTYIDTDGYIKNNTSGYPRINHRYNSTNGTYECAGLLIEESRQNLFAQSENFASGSGWAPNNGSVTANTTTAPNNTLTADTFTQTGTTTAYFTVTNNTFTSGRVYTSSMYVKKIDVSEVYILFYGSNFNSGGSNCIVLFNLDTVTSSVVGGVVANHGIEDVGNGWRRIWASFTATTTVSANNQYLRFKDPGATSNIYVWGAQLEESTSGAFVTSYIPTSGSIVTRNAEIANILNLSPWFNTAEGTLIVEFDSVEFGVNRFPRVASLVDSGGQTNIFQMVGFGSNRNVYSSAWDNGSFLASTSTGNFQNLSKCRISFTYDSSVFRGNFNGGVVSGGNINATLTSEFNRLSIGHLTGGASLNGHIHSIAYYPKKFTDEMLVEATRI